MGVYGNIDRIKLLAQQQNKTISGLCGKIGKPRGFLNDVKRGKNHFTESQLRIFADELHTTMDYLTDRTDDPSPYDIASISGIQGTLNLYRLETRCMICKHKLSELERAVDLPEDSIRMARYGMYHFSAEEVERIAKYLQTTSDYLLNYTEDPTRAVNKTVRIKVWGEVAAGEPIEQVVDFFTDDSDNWEEIDYRDADNENYFALRIKGNSMIPRMNQNDIIIVHQQSSANNGDYVIAAFDDDLTNARTATCKRFQRNDNGIELIPENKEYTPFSFTYEEAQRINLSIIGKVVEIRSKL